MRIIACIAISLVACASEPDDEVCIDHPIPCDPDTPTKVDVTVRWSFETHSGDAKSPCLPGSPDVTLKAGVSPTGLGPTNVVPCANGEAQMSITAGLNLIRVTSVTDHEYLGSISMLIDQSHDLLPTIIVYTDAP